MERSFDVKAEAASCQSVKLKICGYEKIFPNDCNGSVAAVVFFGAIIDDGRASVAVRCR